MRVTSVIGVVLIAALGAVGATAQSQRVTSTVASDYGDAPDGAPAGYVDKPGVRGAFPSRAARGGPRHPAFGPRIGTRWTGEADSRQVDADVDDGAQLNPRSCALSTLSVVIDATRVDVTTPLYVNAWFDWNQDGDWADGGTQLCGPEWGIQNMLIEPAALGADRVAVLTLRVRAGRVPSQFWWRVQVHAGTPAPHAAGAGEGPTDGGETEDLFFNRLPPPRQPQIGLRCDQAVGIVLHGGTSDADFTLVGGRGERVSVTRVQHRVFGATGGLHVRRLASAGTRWRVKVRSTRRHERTPVVQVAVVGLDVEALVNGRPRSFRGTCGVLIVHARRFAPPFQRPGITVPAFSVVINPDQPDPATAGCRTRFTPVGFTLGVVGASGGTVDVQCDGVDVKSMSVSAGAGGQKIAGFAGTGLCEIAPTAGRALRCTFRDPNKGRIVGFSYSTDLPFGSTRIHVLAGGFTPGGSGTAIVLVQDFFFPREGMTCSQTVPRTATCASL